MITDLAVTGCGDDAGTVGIREEGDVVHSAGMALYHAGQQPISKRMTVWLNMMPGWKWLHTKLGYFQRCEVLFLGETSPSQMLHCMMTMSCSGSTALA
jgi:hypothetical protein